MSKLQKADDMKINSIDKEIKALLSSSIIKFRDFSDFIRGIREKHEKSQCASKDSF